MKSTKYAIGSLAAVVALLSASAAAQAAPQTAVWKMKPAAVDAGQSLSCVSTTNCVTIGLDFGNTYAPVLQRWNGTGWSAPQTLPKPSSTASAAYAAIHCVTASFCVAAGTAGTEHTFPAAAIWNGKSWSAQLAAKGTSGTLDAVDCASTTNCVAVGYVDGPERVLAVHWNGKTWSRDTLPSSIGTQTFLGAVSCSGASNCVAVGYGGQVVPIIVRWNGTTWKSEAPQMPAGNPRTVLSDVSCAAQNDCYAVGHSVLDDGHRYMLHSDGSRWSIVDTPAPPRGTNDSDIFSALTCTVHVCTVAGSVANFSSSPPQYTLFVDRGAGNHWSVESTPAIQKGVAGLDDVACPSATTCYAIGYRQVSHTSTQNLFEQRAAH